MKQPRLFPQTIGLFGVLILLIAAFIFGKMQGGFVSWFLFYAFLIIVLYEMVVFLFVLRGLQVAREISSERLSSGSSIEVRIKITRRSYLPIAWMWVTDQAPETFHVSPKQGAKLLFPWFKREMAYTYRCEKLQRGKHTWPGITVQSGDLFGLIHREKKWILSDEVLVYPAIQEISAWNTVNEMNHGAIHVLHRGAEDVTSVIGVRDYAHGDRLSRIHWKASARGTGLKTKEFELQTATDVMFFLDRRIGAYPQEKYYLFERAVSLVASLSRYALNHHFSVGIVSYGQARYVLPPTRREDALLHICEHLAAAQADGSYSFSQTLHQEGVYLSRGTTFVCVTPQLETALIEMIRLLRARGFKVAIFWVRASRTPSAEEEVWVQALEQMNVEVTIMAHERFAETVREKGVAHA